MARSDSTLDLDYFNQARAAAPVRGIVLLFSGAELRCAPHALVDDALIVGRGAPKELMLEDLAMSRQHVGVRFTDGRFEVRDLGSRNGLVVDGQPVSPHGLAPDGARLVRAGRTVFLLAADLRPYLLRSLRLDGDQVIGPVLAQAWDELDAAAKSSDVVHLSAASGAGKELAARRFHAQGKRPEGPFVAVNCAAIPEGVAERLLFGTKKGAFSGATENADGYFQAAAGGTLFLDEVAELDLDVQAKLLRVLETGEVLPLGASKAVSIDVRIVSATHRDLREAVSAKRFREDLFFRLCRPKVWLPPVRDRPEEIAYLAAAAAARIDRSLLLSPAFVEACLLREWPGNVRELLQEVEDAARRAGRAGAAAIEPEHLDEEAGRRWQAADVDSGATARAGKSLPPDDVIEAALAKNEGRVASTAKELDVHRNQLRRWLKRRSPVTER
ncbi:MAG: sigma 54-interacting transcriptional regulator [Deltaproteobacteria bacterium]|nr:sigma 54-interacting transcriptional regulator [Deltaproteobacteria bacterium]